MDEDEAQKAIDKITLIKAVLKLSPVHDPVEAVRILYEEGHDCFEKIRLPYPTP